MFKQANGLTIHMNSHTNERRYECTVCDIKYKTLPVLQNHICGHSGKRIYVCTVTYATKCLCDHVVFIRIEQSTQMFDHIVANNAIKSSYGQTIEKSH